MMNPRAIFYIGFVVYLLGYTSVFFDFGILEFLKIVGMLISTFGVIRWLRSSGLGSKFEREKGEDGLTYFGNKIVLRLWSGMFFIMMLFGSLTYLLELISN